MGPRARRRTGTLTLEAPLLPVVYALRTRYFPVISRTFSHSTLPPHRILSVYARFRRHMQAISGKSEIFFSEEAHSRMVRFPNTTRPVAVESGGGFPKRPRIRCVYGVASRLYVASVLRGVWSTVLRSSPLLSRLTMVNLLMSNELTLLRTRNASRCRCATLPPTLTSVLWTPAILPSAPTVALSACNVTLSPSSSSSTLSSALSKTRRARRRMASGVRWFLTSSIDGAAMRSLGRLWSAL